MSITKSSKQVLIDYIKEGVALDAKEKAHAKTTEKLDGLREKGKLPKQSLVNIDGKHYTVGWRTYQGFFGSGRARISFEEIELLDE